MCRRIRAVAIASANDVGADRVSAPISFAESFSNSAMILFAASATAGRGVFPHTFRTACMPRTLNEPGFCREPASFAARRLQIDVLWIAKKLGWRGAE